MLPLASQFKYAQSREMDGRGTGALPLSARYGKRSDDCSGWHGAAQSFDVDLFVDWDYDVFCSHYTYAIIQHYSILVAVR